jgi:Domain of unknown function (DUF4203)
MFFQAVLVSLIAILIGLALTLSGYRFFIILLPIWGFFAGFSATGTTIRGLWGTGFFNTVFSWVIGLLVGLLFAVLAYLFYYAAIIILGATVGYMLGIGFMTWIGFQLGFISLMVGLILAVIFAFGVWYLKVPKLLIIILTSLAGAASLLAGVFLAFGTIPLADLQWGAVGAVVRQSWWWTLVYLALAGIGVAAQWVMTSSQYTLDAYSREVAVA